jgi:hypothetical protein
MKKMSLQEELEKMSLQELEAARRGNSEALQYLLKVDVLLVLGQRKDALKCATTGDWDLLGDYVRRGGRITPEMRPFLADVLGGKITKPDKKISKAKTAQRNVELVCFIWDARQRGDKNIPRQAEERFGRTWRQLQKILASMKDRKRIEQHRSTFVAMVSAMERRLAGVSLAGGGGPKYRLSDTALTPHTLT